jgi:antitoxin component YwqK of YwqJK toxin-antitoxin module
VRDGPFVEYHRNGKKAREGAYAAGRETGRFTLWYESGQVEEESEWRDGVPHGIFVSYWRSGTKRAEGRRCAGASCGTWRSWDERGTLLGTTELAVPRDVP